MQQKYRSRLFVDPEKVSKFLVWQHNFVNLSRYSLTSSASNGESKENNGSRQWRTEKRNKEHQCSPNTLEWNLVLISHRGDADFWRSTFLAPTSSASNGESKQNNGSRQWRTEKRNKAHQCSPCTIEWIMELTWRRYVAYLWRSILRHPTLTAKK